MSIAGTPVCPVCNQPLHPIVKPGGTTVYGCGCKDKERTSKDIEDLPAKLPDPSDPDAMPDIRKRATKPTAGKPSVAVECATNPTSEAPCWRYVIINADGSRRSPSAAEYPTADDARHAGELALTYG